MHLTPDALEGAYIFLKFSTPDLRKLPHHNYVSFKVSADRNLYGSCTATKNKKHLEISAYLICHSDNLIRRMAHEMIHLKQYLDKTETPNAIHNAEFLKIWRRISKHHGFDPKDF